MQNDGFVDFHKIFETHHLRQSPLNIYRRAPSFLHTGGAIFDRVISTQVHGRNGGHIGQAMGGIFSSVSHRHDVLLM